MMRKVKVKGPKKSSTLKRMNINLYGDKVTAPKLELPTAQFGDQIIGGTSQPDPGNIRSTTKTSAIEETKLKQEAKDQGLGKTIGLGVAGLFTGALSAIPVVGGAFEGLNEKVQEKDKSGVASITSGIGGAAVGTTAAVLSGGTMGVGDITEGVGDIMGGSSEIAYNKGNDKRSEKLGKAEQAFDTIAPIADMASGFAGGGAEGAAGMFGGPEGFKGGMKSLLGGMPYAKFGTKLPLEMELMPENGMMVDGYLHEEGGVITKSKGKPVAEIEGGEGITKDGVVYSDTTINPETGKPFSRDAKKITRIKDDNTRKLAEEELYIKQEKAKEMQGLENIGEMGMKKYKKGGSFMYGKKLNLPKMQGGDKIPQDKNYLRDLAKLGDLAKKDGIFRPMSGDGTINYEPGVPTLQKDIFSATEKGISGDPKLKTLGERFFRNADGSLNYNNKKLRGGEKKDGKEEEEEGGKGNLTPGDKTQLAGNMIPPLANLAAMKSIRENTVDYGKDRSIIRDQKISTADMERTARQERAATITGLTAMGNDAVKSAVSANTTKAIQDAQLEAARINTQSAMTKDQLEMQKSQFNVKQEDLTKLDRQDRRDLATTTGLTAAEQTGKALVDLGLTENQSTTNATQLKILKEAFPDYTIDADNMKAFVRKLASNGDITRFKINPEN